MDEEERNQAKLNEFWKFNCKAALIKERGVEKLSKNSS